MSRKDDALPENPYIVRSDFEQIVMDSGETFHTEKLVMPKFPTMTVPKMFSKSSAKEPAPAKAAAPAKALPKKSAPPMFSDLQGNPLSDDGSLVPKMCVRPDYKAPVTDLDKMFEQTKDPKRMFDILQKKYKMNKDRSSAIPCDWRMQGESVHACMVLENNNCLLLCYAKGDLKKLGMMMWKPVNITDYMTGEKITKPIMVPVKTPTKNYSALWFTS